MPDDTNSELVNLLSEQLPASPAERDLAQRRRRQPGTTPDRDNSVLAGILAGGIGADARFPLSVRRMTSNPTYTLGGKRMEGQRPMTAQEQAMQDDPARALAYGAGPIAELSGAPQMIRAGLAANEAYQVPTLPNVTKAGAETGMAVLRPAGAAKILAAGYTAAAAEQSGLLDTPAAAQTKKGIASKEVMPGLSAEQQAEYDRA